MKFYTEYRIVNLLLCSIEMVEEVMTYIYELANIHYLARRLREQEERLADMCDRLEEQAEAVQRRANVAA